MAIKMIVSDIDGTLIDNVTAAYVLPDSAKEAVRRAQKRGIIVTLSTGRMYKSAKIHAARLDLAAPLIVYNGALIKSEKEGTIYETPLSPATVRAVLEYAFARDIYVQIYAGDELYFASRDENAKFYENASKIKGFAVGRDGLWEKAALGSPKALITTDSEEKAIALVKDINAKFAGRVHAMQSSATYVEVVSPQVNKGAAVAFLAGHYGLKREEVMALGDAENDISMLEYAGVGVAMGNAPEKVKAAADFVTSPVGADGFAKAIEKFALKD